MYTRAWNTALYLKYLLGKWYASNCIHKMMGNLYTLSAGRSHHWIGFNRAFSMDFHWNALCMADVTVNAYVIIEDWAFWTQNNRVRSCVKERIFTWPVSDGLSAYLCLGVRWDKPSHSTRLGALITYPHHRDKSFSMQTALTLLTLFCHFRQKIIRNA